MMFRNLTPHAVKLFRGNEVVLEVVPEAKENQARVGEVVIAERMIAGFPVVVKDYTDTNLPEVQEGVYLIVSKMVIDACPGRGDLLCPDTGPDSVVRDEAGRILGTRRLQAGK